MADTTPKEAKISLKVMVHKAKNRAIYAEADSSFVDILFSFMTLPLATIVRILGKCSDQKVEVLGSLKNLYQSLTDLPANYLATDESKHMLLNPRSSSYDICKKLKINIDDTDPPKFFISSLACIKCHGAYFSLCNLARCSYCRNLMTWEIKNEDPVTDTGDDGGVFVSDVTTFIVTEDLRVFPNATGVSIQLLCDFGISDASQLEVRNLDVGLEQADSSFVDILFSFMTLPLATLVRILGKCPDQKVEALGSLKNLYQSLTDLPANYLATDESKHMLLNPRSSSYYICKKLKINIDDTDTPKFFISSLACIKCHGACFSLCNLARCSYCRNLMTWEIKNEDPVTDTGDDGGVFVSDVTTFIVTEDLRVFPNATGVSIQLLCDFGISDASQLEVRNLDVGLEQILMFFKGALLLKYPLTFLLFPNTNLTQQYSNYLQQGTSIQHVINKEIATNSKRMMLKIVLQKSTSKFLFAEAEEDFVDFVFGFLQIPLGTIVGKLMNGSSSLMNLDNLFASASDLKVGKHIKSQDLRENLLQPQLVQNYLSKNNIFPLKVSNSPQIYCHSYKINEYYRETLAYMTHSIKNNGRMDERCDALNLKDPRVQGGFVKASAKFMLTDDLVTTPLSTFSTIALLNKLKVPMHDVVEHELSIGIVEWLHI
ncbi:hypothetical protein CTI12_AA117060 [Artemisia annua]|uniref:DUF674 family protein n=1 Tax=Artemisia annua TaxID=35608 RepID=A0A2U1PSX6_ARTAN|nr:hypothetical protein CTI12_AA117060 [Artemisia annua]